MITQPSRCQGSSGAPFSIICLRRHECARYAPHARFVPGETRHSRLMPLRCEVWRNQFEEFLQDAKATQADQVELFA